MDSLNNPQRVQALLEEIASHNDYAHRSGVRMTRITPDLAEGILDATPDAYNPLGMVHGGFLYMFADTVAGVAVWALTGTSHVTMESSIHFLRPAKAGRLRAIAKPIKLGRQVCVYSVEIFDSNEKKVFYATLTFFQKQPNAT
ncbi:MAG: PaaI family thioesterase [Oscillospiraceae bacterium]|nr:PaaI family thioesterase [Oscillospiraceae bacterium]